ncbi:hypothetical protein HYU92_02230 [Candidatus Curtissbacteria bacterium]|nr:hypothetical protein [Candidatus Curtissbacteria bacterium]
MNYDCLRQISKGVFICTVTSVIVYESFLGHSHEHAPDPQYFQPPTQFVKIISTATIGTSSFGTSNGS